MCLVISCGKNGLFTTTCLVHTTVSGKQVIFKRMNEFLHVALILQNGYLRTLKEYYLPVLRCLSHGASDSCLKYIQ